MGTLRLESILVGNVHDLEPLTVRSGEGEVSVGVDSIVAGLGCTDSIASLVVVRVRPVRIDHGVLVEGFCACFISAATTTTTASGQGAHPKTNRPKTATPDWKLSAPPVQICARA
uniref:Uncharacterized protein n=1 Tax=Anopheles farauti TaxID=69004 RepID=A0A182QNP3_9DIPT